MKHTLLGESVGAVEELNAAHLLLLQSTEAGYVPNRPLRACVRTRSEQL
jgi:hypothetical protein